MSLTLDATLQTRMNGIERQPIAQIVSTSFADSIPYDGNYLGISQSNYVNLDAKALSTGALSLTSYSSVAPELIRFMLTDNERAFWTEYTINGDGYSSYFDQGYYPFIISHCEKPDGNIAIAWVNNWSSSTRRIRVTTLNISGTWTPNGTLVWTSATNDTINSIYLIYHPNSSNYQLYMAWYDSSAGSYYLYRNTSSNLSSWAGWTDITPASLGSTMEYLSIHAVSFSDNDIVVSFDRVNLIDANSDFKTTSIYYMVSQDDGSTWSTPTLAASYTGVGMGGRHPSVVEKSTSVYLTFHERASFVKFDKNTTGAVYDNSTDSYPHLTVDALWLYNGYLYCQGSSTEVTKHICGMWKVDPADMTVDAQYTSTTTPGYDPNLLNYNAWYMLDRGAGKYFAKHVGSFGTNNMGQVIVAINDGVTETIVQYIIGSGGNHGGYGWDENVSVARSTTWAGASNFSVVAAYIDATNDRLYVRLQDAYLYSGQLCVGYIDLTESPDPVTGYYTWNEIFRKTSSQMNSSYGWTGSASAIMTNGVYCKEDHVLLFWRDSDNDSSILVIDAETGVIQFAEQHHTEPNLPYHGLYSGYVYDNKIYGSFEYSVHENQGSWRGLWIYDMVSGAKICARPGYATKDQYTFYDYDFADIGNNYIWIGGWDGAIRYHTGSQFFELWDDTVIPGFSMGLSSESCYRIAYDVANQDVYVGQPYGFTSAWAGVRRFNINGDYYKGKYLSGTKSGTDLQLGSASDLTHGWYEADIISVAAEDDVMWSFWDHITYTDSTRKIYWDHDESETDVSDDLVDVVEVSHAIDTPSELRFSLAYGHLYEQQNLLSSKSYMFRRGRKVNLKFGENISGTPYWVEQGSFIVEETQMRYIRGDYPVLEVVARDLSSLWQDARIALSAYYSSAQPKTIMEDLLDDWTVLDGADYSIPTFANSHEIWHQWSDETLYDILKDILDHFGYTFFFTTVGVFQPKRINFSAAVDHAYSNQLQIQEYTPDTSFSNFVNQVRVIGETHDTIEVLYDPELITNVNGTCGWWDETIEHQVWYDEDRQRTCRNPFLNPIISTRDFEWFLFKGGGGERISGTDNNELYCYVEIQGPNLIPVVVGLAVSCIALGSMALYCFTNCGPFIFATNVNISLLIYAILATATYDIEVWAQPVGNERQTIQYVATDTQQMNIVNQQPVIEEIEDSLCYTVADCQRVATFELNVLRYQRERVRLSKLTHLQDELLDMITVKHPYSNTTLQLMIASLKRTLVIKGSMMDMIEGWRIV